MNLDAHSLVHAAAHNAAHAGARLAAFIAAAQNNTLAHRIWRWLRHLGAPGLIVLGLVDNSPIPLTGSMDALTIVLAAHQRNLWPYYALMATAGAVLGGYLSYRVGRKGGEDALEGRVSRKRLRWVKRSFRRWGFSSIVVAVILPPPMPVVPFLLAAGATRYPASRFLAALTLGRVVRYGLLAYFSTIYGRQILELLSAHGYQLLAAYLALLVFLTAVMLLQRHKSKSAKDAKRAAAPARAS